MYMIYIINVCIYIFKRCSNIAESLLAVCAKHLVIYIYIERERERERFYKVEVKRWIIKFGMFFFVKL